MRIRPILLAATLAIVAVTAAFPAGATLADTPVASDNVDLLGHIPEAGAVGGKIKVVNTIDGPKRYFIMTGAQGVSAYDVTIPEAPVLAGHLPLPHWENEDVEFGEDLLIISQDPAWLDWFTPPGTLGGLYLIDISNLPLMTFAYTNPATGNRWTAPVKGYQGHTVTCIRSDCSWATVNGERTVNVVDLRNPAAPVLAGSFNSTVGGTHDGQMDDAGVLWMVGDYGIAGFDVSNPASPRRIVAGGSGGMNYHHNSMRPNATSWTPRTTGFNDPAVRPGELVMISEEEIYGQIACNGQGRFQTRWLRDSDSLTSGAAPRMDVLDTWVTELQVANIVAPAAVCSAHYFDERDGIVAVAWYEQGIRFLDVSNPRDIRQVGYFIPRQGEPLQTVWAGEGALGGEIVYTMDLARGIDILRFNRTSSMPEVKAPILPEWLAPSPVTFTPHPVWGYACGIRTL